MVKPASKFPVVLSIRFSNEGYRNLVRLAEKHERSEAGVVRLLVNQKAIEEGIAKR
jgi:hypothetical protein